MFSPPRLQLSCYSFFSSQGVGPSTSSQQQSFGPSTSNQPQSWRESVEQLETNSANQTSSTKDMSPRGRGQKLLASPGPSSSPGFPDPRNVPARGRPAPLTASPSANASAPLSGSPWARKPPLAGGGFGGNAVVGNRDEFPPLNPAARTEFRQSPGPPRPDVGLPWVSIERWYIENLRLCVALTLNYGYEDGRFFLVSPFCDDFETHFSVELWSLFLGGVESTQISDVVVECIL